MKRILFFTMLLVIPLLVLAGTIFQEAGGQGNQVTWKTSDETGVSQFIVIRREWQTTDWGPEAQVEVVNAKGTGSSYSLEDKGIFKTADRALKYEIRAVTSQGIVIESITYQTRFAGLTSAAKRTWGSIKAMFR
jgi:hypothetical protein